MHTSEFKKGSIIFRAKTLFDPISKLEAANNDEIGFILNDSSLQSYSLLTVYGKQKLLKNSMAFEWQSIFQ